MSLHNFINSTTILLFDRKSKSIFLFDLLRPKDLFIEFEHQRCT